MLPGGFYDAVERGSLGGLAEISEYSDRTYDLGNMRRFVDGREAVGQAVVKILNTERFRCGVYSDDYGIELDGLFGKDSDFVCVELERKITEALTADRRITGVCEFEFTVKRSVIYAAFTVNTIYGDFEINQEVKLSA